MLEWSRFRGIVAAISGLIVALALMSLLLSATMGRLVRFPAADSTMEMSCYEIIGSGISAHLRNGTATSRAKRVGVLLGSSTLGYGVDPTQLEAESDPPTRWLSVRGNGASATDLSDAFRFMIRCEVAPNSLVVGIHSGMLSQSRDFLSDPKDFQLAMLREHIVRGQVLPLKRDLESLGASLMSRAFPNRIRTNHYARQAIFQARLWIFESFGVPLRSLYPPRDWSIPAMVVGEHCSRDVALELFDAVVRKRGWLNPLAYDSNNANSQALRRLIEMAHESGIEVIVVIMPESSYLRSMMPAEAGECLNAVLRKPAIESKCAVLDFHSAIADDMFYDTCHLDPTGIKLFTQELGSALRKLPER